MLHMYQVTDCSSLAIICQPAMNTGRATSADG
jgi:hypothetical protein